VAIGYRGIRTNEKEIQLKNKKLIAATIATGVAISLGTASVSSADDRGFGRGADLSTVLNGLKDRGTLTQSQVDAIESALKDSKSAARAEMVAAKDAFTKVLTDTLGISASDLMARMKAGETLASIAGSKKDALISAIVAFQTKTIDDALAAGKITGDQASKLKSKLVERTTSMVERAKGLGKGFGLEFKGGKGHGKGPRS